MPDLTEQLDVDRCPHCGIASPHLLSDDNAFESEDRKRTTTRMWRVYVCQSCGGAVLAWAFNYEAPIQEMFPRLETVPKEVPSPAIEYLLEAIESKHSPSACVMVANSSIDAMLKDKGYKQGKLYNRIEKAAQDHVLTAEMAEWAHNVRLDANEPRHVDDCRQEMGGVGDRCGKEEPLGR